MPTTDSRLGFRLGQEQGCHTTRKVKDPTPDGVATQPHVNSQAQETTKPPYHPVQEKVHHKATERCVMAYFPHIDTAKGAAPRHRARRVSTHPRTASQAAHIHNDAVLCCHATHRTSYLQTHHPHTRTHCIVQARRQCMHTDKYKAGPRSKETHPHSPTHSHLSAASASRHCPFAGPVPAPTVPTGHTAGHDTGQSIRTGNLQAVSRTHSRPTSAITP